MRLINALRRCYQDDCTELKGRLQTINGELSIMDCIFPDYQPKCSIKIQQCKHELEIVSRLDLDIGTEIGRGNFTTILKGTRLEYFVLTNNSHGFLVIVILAVKLFHVRSVNEMIFAQGKWQGRVDVAIKQVRNDRLEQEIEFFKEFNILKIFDHPNIIQVRSIYLHLITLTNPKILLRKIYTISFD